MKERAKEIGYYILLFIWVGTGLAFTVDVANYIFTGKTVWNYLSDKIN